MSLLNIYLVVKLINMIFEKRNRILLTDDDVTMPNKKSILFFFVIHLIRR